MQFKEKLQQMKASLKEEFEEKLMSITKNKQSNEAEVEAYPNRYIVTIKRLLFYCGSC